MRRPSVQLLVPVSLLLLASAPAFSGNVAPVTGYALTGGNIKTQTKAYAGLNWTLGGSMTPSIVLGLAQARVKDNGNTQGANLSLYFNLSGGLMPSQIKLGYLSGKNDAQGLIGTGYNFTTSSYLFTVGANGANVGGGVDWSAGNFTPYGTVHSQGKFDKPTPCVATTGASVRFSDAACTQGDM